MKSHARIRTYRWKNSRHYTKSKEALVAQNWGINLYFKFWVFQENMFALSKQTRFADAQQIFFGEGKNAAYISQFFFWGLEGQVCPYSIPPQLISSLIQAGQEVATIIFNIVQLDPKVLLLKRSQVRIPRGPKIPNLWAAGDLSNCSPVNSRPRTSRGALCA